MLLSDKKFFEGHNLIILFNDHVTVRRKEIKWSRPKYPPPWGIASFSKVAVHSAMEKNKIRLQCSTYNNKNLKC